MIVLLRHSRCPEWIIYCFLIAGLCAGCADSRHANEGSDFKYLRKDVGPLILDPNQPTNEVRQEFLVQNPSRTAQMELTLYQRSCNCTEFSVEPTITAPGETAVVTLRSSLPIVTENHELRVVFKTALDEMPLVALALNVRCLAALYVLPSKFPEMAVPIADSAQFEFEVISNRLVTEPDLPIEIRPPGSNLQITKKSKSDAEHDGIVRTVQSYTVQVNWPESIDPTANRLSEQMVIQRGGRQFTQQVMWSPIYPVRALPDQVLLQVGAKDNEKFVELKSADPFQVLSLRCEPASFLRTRLLTDGARREHRIALAATASDELPRGSVIKVFAELDHVSQSQVVIVANVLNLNPVKKP